MLVRALFVVLMTVGPIPFRVCTCGASAEAAHDARQHESGVQHDEHDESGAPERAGRHSHHHHHDCLSANAHPITATTAEAPTPVAPADVWHALVTLEPVRANLRAASTAPRPSSASVVPIYLSCCALRN